MTITEARKILKSGGSVGVQFDSGDIDAYPITNEKELDDIIDIEYPFKLERI